MSAELTEGERMRCVVCRQQVDRRAAELVKTNHGSGRGSCCTRCSDEADGWLREVNRPTDAELGVARELIENAAGGDVEFVARALASQRAEIVARYEKAMASVIRNVGEIWDSEQAEDLINSIREAAPK